MSTLVAAWLGLAASLAFAETPPEADASDAPPTSMQARVPAGACDAPTTNDAIVAALEAANTAYEQLEMDAFSASVGAASQAVDCLSEPIARSTAAELHRVRGLLAVVERDEESAKRSFAAARAVEPSYTFPVSRVPEGNPVRLYYTALDPRLLPVEQAPNPQDGAIRLDGSTDRKRLTGLPVVFQIVDGGGAVRSTQLLAPGAALPSYPTQPEPRVRKGPQPATLIAGLAVGAVAAGVYGGAVASRSGYDNATTVDQKLSRRPVTNGLVITSGALGAVAIGLGTLSVVNGRF